MKSPRREVFELSILGGPTERAYRRLRPEIERMPWGSLDPSRYPAPVLAEARQVWSFAAFQEHRTGACCAATIEALIASRAPIDLVVMASRFPVDEMAHVELCARLAMAVGGAPELVYDPDELVFAPPPDHSPALRCAEMVVRFFCVGEAVSIPLLRLSARRAQHPLIRAVLQRIAKDEAAHGRFGFLYLDWIGDELSAADREWLGGAARDEVRKLEGAWRHVAGQGPEPEGERLGWAPRGEYLDAAYRALDEDVVKPLAARGIAFDLRRTR